MFFRASIPGGHEKDVRELAALIERSNGRPSESDTKELRERWGIEQLTPLAAG